MSGLLGVDPDMMDTFQYWATTVFSGPVSAWQIKDKAERERAGGTEMMVCVDRATGPLTLDV
jgi:hypothetical protein